MPKNFNLTAGFAFVTLPLAVVSLTANSQRTVQEKKSPAILITPEPFSFMTPDFQNISVVTGIRYEVNQINISGKGMMNFLLKKFQQILRKI
jgi:hypothetical protein